MEAPTSTDLVMLALIPARGGSKGLPRKNLLLAGGKPLLAWTIEAAQGSSFVTRVVLTSEDEEIVKVAAKYGCDVPFMRPQSLAEDESSTMDVVLHALEHLPDYEYIVLLQPTSPLRNAADIDAAYQLMRERGAPSCVSVSEAEQSPYWMYKVGAGDRLQSLLPPLAGVTRRQELPTTYVLNGAIYIARCDWLRSNGSFIGESTVAYRMPIDRSIDIDSADDFELFRRRVEK